ncbi:holo-[acyl-carrier-protein] synthase-like protein [Thermochaetoides thermophila DSM 1495]|uniref:holo-[acyl-carrier-protein] synthase n=1 Tax=Chaetomium thermophilum (strain DSM 1495 / CBS 144.50 / IMI 039719) TaxID=759272 RepID=G0S1X0_CHATD|nr:holo-[acyl-carrier-protein] synthase-like protein [Thermochaetoides thermophila DSM 1495]EGS23030.1 holo-[acyl-carrier-protein] synthase-like protein [Thermochaetoides thermophila DSM 1495]
MALASSLLKHYAIARLSTMISDSGSDKSVGDSGHGQGGIPWDRTIITRDSLTKPVFVDPRTGRQPVSFNVSHQAGIVALVAVAGYEAPPNPVDANAPPSTPARGQRRQKVPVEVGVDVVCVSERRERDLAMLWDESEGWEGFVDMHADVFSPSEVAYLKGSSPPAPRPPPGPASAARRSRSRSSRGSEQYYQQSPEQQRYVRELSPEKQRHYLQHLEDLRRRAEEEEDEIEEGMADGKLRMFYALWALREAYVKLTGEALLAEWLSELEFRDFRAPKPTAAWEVPACEERGEVVRDIEIYFRGQRVDDVNMCIRSMGPDYMIATAVRTPGRKEDGLAWQLGPYEILSLEDVLDFAAKSRLGGR